jgi:hypothetical protein
MKTMKKAALLVGAAVAIMAMALPAAASAARLENSSGNLLAKGSLFTVKNQGTVVYETTYGKISCAQIGLNEELVKNDGQVVSAIERSPGYSNACFVGGKAFNQELKFTGLKFEGTGAGTVGLSFDIQYPWGKCHLQNEATPVKYVPGSSAFSVTKAAMNATPAACAPFVVTGEFKLADSGGNPLILN